VGSRHGARAGVGWARRVGCVAASVPVAPPAYFRKSVGKMVYEIINAIDSRMPSWPGDGTPFTLFACHDTEGGTGRTGARGTIAYLINNPSRGASYHEIWSYEPAIDHFAVFLIVPASRAAGSVNPNPPAYAPDNWVRTALGVNANDPNQGSYAISIAGRVADVNYYSTLPKFRAHATRRFNELRAQLRVTKRAEHFRYNPSTRTDWGKLLTPALGGLTLPTSPVPTPIPDEDEMIDPNIVIPGETCTILPGGTLYAKPDRSARLLDIWPVTSPANNVGLYGMPNQVGALAPIRVDVSGLKIGWIGADKITNRQVNVLEQRLRVKDTEFAVIINAAAKGKSA
jgi:hypothetical protein